MACASHFLINDDIKIVRTPKNMAASVVNLPGMTLQPLYSSNEGGGGGGGGGGGQKKLWGTPSSNIVGLNERITNLLLK